MCRHRPILAALGLATLPLLAGCPLTGGDDSLAVDFGSSDGPRDLGASLHDSSADLPVSPDLAAPDLQALDIAAADFAAGAMLDFSANDRSVPDPAAPDMAAVLDLAPRDLAPPPDHAGIQDIATPATYDLANADFAIIQGCQGFAAPITIQLGVYPDSLAAADFNGDGKLDIAIGAGTFNLKDTLAVVLGDGKGGFQAPLLSPVTVPGASGDLAVGDLNGDGALDMVVTGPVDRFGSGSAVVYLNNGNGAFTSQPNPLELIGTDSGGVALGDFDEDGILDAAITAFNNNLVDNQISDEATTVFFGKGDGTFPRRNDLKVLHGIEYGPGGPAVGDFNNDGHLDIAIVTTLDNLTMDATYRVYLGDGRGNFIETMLDDPAGKYGGLGTGDFNRDGNLDVVTGDRGLLPALGNGAGWFVTSGDFPLEPPLVGFDSAGPAIGDLNHDGKLDFAVSIENSPGDPAMNLIEILFGDGNGTFEAPVACPKGVGTSDLVIADFNGDGKNDLVVANYFDATLTVLLQK